MARTTGRAARGNHGSRAMVIVWLIGAVFVCGLGVFGLALRTPAWFREGAVDTTESRRLAQRLENRIITEAYRFRGEPVGGDGGVRRTGEDWSLRVSEDEATAWLGVKLSEWLANREPPARLPPGLIDVQAHFSSGRAWVAGRFEENVYTLSAGARVDERGVWLVAVRAGVGSLRLPAAWGGLGLIGLSASDDALSQFWRVVAGNEPLLAGGSVRLEDGRRVRVVGVRIDPGAIELVCRTEVP